MVRIVTHRAQATTTTTLQAVVVEVVQVYLLALVVIMVVTMVVTTQVVTVEQVMDVDPTQVAQVEILVTMAQGVTQEAMATVVTT